MKIGDIVEYADDYKHLTNYPNRVGKIVGGYGDCFRVHWDGNKNPSPPTHASHLKGSQKHSKSGDRFSNRASL